MDEKMAVRRAMERRAISQKQLAKTLGLSSPALVAQRLGNAGKSLKVDTFVQMMNACGFDVIVRDRNGGRNGVEWVIDDEPTVVPAQPEKSIEEKLKDGEITFQQAIQQGWVPTAEMLDKMLNS